MVKSQAFLLDQIKVIKQKINQKRNQTDLPLKFILIESNITEKTLKVIPF